MREGKTRRRRPTEISDDRDAPRIPGSLARLVPRAPANEEELAAMARAAWRSQGIVLLHPDRIPDPWERQTVINLAERFYGKRSAGDDA
ncbi:MAG: hypothetical protein QNJ94_17095 [Alphaproteobacteria bacterium]|nr:hypothetical protein [Alphaproteobacteria bacterium]